MSTYYPTEAVASFARFLTMRMARMSTEVDGLRTLTVRQLADATGIQKWRVHELLAEGKGPPHFRIGRTYRFPVAGIKQWLQEQSNQTKIDR